jgi:hypothetical protein
MMPALARDYWGSRLIIGSARAGGMENCNAMFLAGGGKHWETNYRFAETFGNMPTRSGQTGFLSSWPSDA